LKKTIKQKFIKLNNKEIIDWLKKKDIYFTENFELSQRSWIKSGGIVKVYIQPENLNQLSNVIKFLNANKFDYLAIGNLSNSLFRDGLINTPFINLRRIKEDIEILSKDNSEIKIRVSAGISIFKYVNFIQNKFLISGQEGLIGIPGTVGAGIITNASSYDCGISDFLTKVEYINNEGKFIEEHKEELSLGWRKSKFLGNNNFIITNLYFCFNQNQKSNKESINEKALKIKKDREKFQENVLPNLGSLYATKNIYKDLSKASTVLSLLYFFNLFITKLIYQFFDENYLLRFRKFLVKIYLFYFGIDGKKFSLSYKTVNCLVNKGSKSSNSAFELIKKLEKKSNGIIKLENILYDRIK
tara:strand:+ start:3559 stop:4629 length:1071 start_codon:yes stop_codon:yes gene_type:complete